MHDNYLKNNNYRLSKEFFTKPLVHDGICVAQLGRLFSKRNTVIDAHVHTVLFELTVVTEGEGIISTNGVPTRVKKGDIYLSLPCDIHKIETDSEKLLKFDNFAFYLEDEYFKEEFDKIQETCYPPHKRVFQDERIRPLVSNAIMELTDKNLCQHEMLTSIFKQILIYTLRALKTNDSVIISENITQAEVLCYKMMNYIDTHVYSMKKLEELASVCDYSYGYLSTLFKKTTGNTLLNYYQERRLEASRLLLLENKLTITEISELLNYASLFAYSKAFANCYNISPAKYRKQNKELKL